MRPWRRGFMVWVVVGLTVGWAGVAGAGPSAADLCEARKLRAAGKKADCLAKEEAKEVLGANSEPAKCSGPFETAFESAEGIAGPGVCPTEGDTAAAEAQVDACVERLAAALSGATPPATHVFPATGQTTCYNSSGTVIPCAGTGHDGDIQAGATLSYTDNGDGTITDNNTGLMWEKKSDDGTIHDKDTAYTWANAFAVHIAQLNNRCANDETVDCSVNGDADCAGVGGACGFAGYRDWRLSNVKELHSIVNYENFNPAVSSAFNNSCVASCTVLSCSCTESSSYWSSTSYDGTPSNAWYVHFPDGSVLATPKSGTSPHVRAVRGGL